MRIAISSDGNNVSEHFGRCPYYTIVDIEENKVVKEEKVDNPGHEPGLIPKFLNEKGVNCIIAGGMGPRAVTFFNDFKIQTIVGVAGPINNVIEKVLNNTLVSGQSLCSEGGGKGYGVDKTECDHENHQH